MDLTWLYGSVMFTPLLFSFLKPRRRSSDWASCRHTTHKARISFAPFFRRALPALRSLSIYHELGNSPTPPEGHRWREDENGGVSQADAKKPSMQFDGNYIMSISNAAPNLEELELMGTSDDTFVSLLSLSSCSFVPQGPDVILMQDSIPASLSLFPKLHLLTFSGAFQQTLLCRVPQVGRLCWVRVQRWRRPRENLWEVCSRELQRGCTKFSEWMPDVGCRKNG